jgi:phenylalanyl-tRNA synthetase beta subunit
MWPPTIPAAIKLYQYAPVIEDLTFTISGRPAVGHLIDTIKAIDPLIDTVVLKDVYHRNHTFTITYRSNLNSLSSEAVAPIRKAVVTALTKQGHQLVGTV